jgi:hypothetical protein
MVDRGYCLGRAVAEAGMMMPEGETAGKRNRATTEERF